MQKVVIIGAGKVGSALALAIKEAGFVVAGILSKSKKSADILAKRLDCGILNNEREAVLAADIIIIAVPDREIALVADHLAESMLPFSGKTILHTCGSQSAESLACLSDLGANVGSMHPLQSFSTVDLPLSHLWGTYFAVDGNETAVAAAQALIEKINGKFIVINSMHRPLYHAAACMVSNYMVAIIDGALQLMRVAGVDEKEALLALKPMIKGTVNNIFMQGTVQALTGPIARGDSLTIEKHLARMDTLAIAEAELYRAIGKYTVALAHKQGNLSEEQFSKLDDVLSNQNK